MSAKEEKQKRDRRQLKVDPDKAIIKEEEYKQYVTIRVDKQLFGIAVHALRDVLDSPIITSIPLAPKEIAGSLNLRGRILTAIDLRVMLGLQAAEERGRHSMSIVIEYESDLYSIIVDEVGEVLKLPISGMAANPENLSPKWQEFSTGVYPLDGELLVILDINKLLFRFSNNTADKMVI
jgi:purine-binding chemotaxis protein CheW